VSDLYDAAHKALAEWEKLHREYCEMYFNVKPGETIPWPTPKNSVFWPYTEEGRMGNSPSNVALSIYPPIGSEEERVYLRLKDSEVDGSIYLQQVNQEGEWIGTLLKITPSREILDARISSDRTVWSFGPREEKE